MSLLTISGTLTETPAPAQDGSSFPSATTVVPFEQTPGPQPKSVVASTGRKLVNINSANAFVVLTGTGADESVTQALNLYVRVVSGGFKLRLTFADPQGGADIVSILPLGGLFIHETDPGGGYCKKLEVQGAGQVELYESGQQ